MNYLRGSEWRKWDLHVHTPYSILNNQFGSDWDAYVKELFLRAIKSEIAVIGITDYFSIEGYKKLKTEYLQDDNKLKILFNEEIANDPDFITKIRNITVFPNVEFRFKDVIQNHGKDCKIEGHVIFSDKLSVADIESKFFSKLSFLDIESGGNTKNPLNKHNIEEFGKKIKAEQPTFANESDYLVGIKLLVVDCSDMIEVLKENFKGNFEFLIPEDDITTIKWDTQAHMIRKNYYINANGIFTTNEKTIRWGLKPETAKEFRSLKPCFSYSDCHCFDDMFKFANNKPCWVKADPTFEGFKQVFNQPTERVFIGDKPEKIKQIEQKKYYYIDRLMILKNIAAKNKNTWFDADLNINSGLVAIIGNKGSGKSALADILGYMTEAKNMEQASFLNKERFKKEDKKFAHDYQSKLFWKDGRIVEKNFLDSDIINAPTAEFLPQKYIESLCNELKDDFQQEINRVIFSYIDISEKNGTTSLTELIQQKTRDIDFKISKYRNEIEEINKKIISLEAKKTDKYLEEIEKLLRKNEEILKSHINNKPIEVKKPSNTNSDAIEQIENINKEIEAIDQKIADTKSEKLKINIEIDEIKQFLAKFASYQSELKTLNDEAIKIAMDIGLSDFKGIELKFDIKQFKNKIDALSKRRLELDLILQENPTDTDDDAIIYLYQARKQLICKKEEILKTAQDNEIKYETYLKAVKLWEQDIAKIEGTSPSDLNTISYYKAEIDYVKNNLYGELEEAFKKRKEIVKKIFEQLLNKMATYKSLYAPIEEKLQNILKDNSDDICFETVIKIDSNFTDMFLSYIKQNVKGLYYGRAVGIENLNSIIREVDLSTWTGVDLFVGKIQDSISGDPNNIQKLVPNTSNCYDYLNKLEYLNVSFTLKMNGKTLEELSPGQRGIVLLIFYLALSRNSEPLIIDQPEDNLDNQSVFTKLVPCIVEAKKNRQVFIVTHNPNIAVACDAEQVICAEIDKTTNKIHYAADSIENETIRQKIIDILEGTEPAFSLRQHKYFD